CLLGIWQLGHSRQWSLLTLCLAPFALTFLAAALHRYPYGGSARYEQHLAPLICLLAGSGLAAVFFGFGTPFAVVRGRGTVVDFTSLALAGVLCLRHDLVKPYKTEGDQQVRQVVLDIVHQAGPDDQIVVMDPADWLAPTVEWYLRQQGQRIAWNGRIDWAKLHAKNCYLWNLYFSPDPARHDRLPRELNEHAGTKLVMVQHDEQVMQMGWNWDEKTKRYCEYYQWQCTPDQS